MDSVNPYASSRASGPSPISDRERSPWRFFVYSFLFYPVWLFVGFPFVIDGSEESMAVDAGLLVAVMGGSAVTFVMGVIGASSNG